MKLKNNLQFFIFWTVLVVSATSKKKSSKLRLVAENKYDGTNIPTICQIQTTICQTFKPSPNF